MRSEHWLRQMGAAGSADWGGAGEQWYNHFLSAAMAVQKRFPWIPLAYMQKASMGLALAHAKASLGSAANGAKANTEMMQLQQMAPSPQYGGLTPDKQAQWLGWAYPVLWGVNKGSQQTTAHTLNLTGTPVAPWAQGAAVGEHQVSILLTWIAAEALGIPAKYKTAKTTKTASPTVEHHQAPGHHTQAEIDAQQKRERERDEAERRRIDAHHRVANEDRRDAKDWEGKDRRREAMDARHAANPFYSPQPGYGPGFDPGYAQPGYAMPPPPPGYGPSYAPGYGQPGYAAPGYAPSYGQPGYVDPTATTDQTITGSEVGDDALEGALLGTILAPELLGDGTDSSDDGNGDLASLLD